MKFTGRTISQGVAVGEALVTKQGISFFGGVDPDTGQVVERGHELEGQSLAGKVLVFPSGKGSTVGSYTLYRLKHSGCAPLAIVNAECETITAVGCIIAEIPCVDQVALERLSSGQRLLVDGDRGLVEILPPHSRPATDHLPDWLRGREPGSFAEDRLARRLPGIARRVVKEGAWPPEIARRLEALAEEMPLAGLRPIHDPGAPDARLWERYWPLFQGFNWLDGPWFQAEIYFFRRLLEVSGYFQDGPGRQVDPYAPQKQQGLPATLLTLAPWCARLEENPPGQMAPAQVQDTLARLLRASIWGNQADQSVWPAGSQAPQRPDEDVLAEALLVDDSNPVAAYLVQAAGLLAVDPAPEIGADPRRVDFILDNSGLELAYDLLLADFLLQSRLAEQVVFHGKMYTTYVSDVTLKDLLEMLDYLQQEDQGPVARLALRLTQALAQGRFLFKAHPFWVSPYAGWDMPADLWAELHHSVLVISKGDANYRRWVGDRHWPTTVPFDVILAYRPAALLALRVFKSDAVCGLHPGQANALQAKDPDWLFNGHWGLIQFASPMQ